MLGFTKTMDHLSMTNSVRWLVWSCVAEIGWSCHEKGIRH